MIEVSGRLSEEDLDDAARLARSRWYWPKLLFQTWHGLLLAAGIVWATVLGLVGRTQPKWWALGVIWLLIVAIGVRSAISARRERRENLTRLNARLPETITLGSDGLAWRHSGELVTIPWAEVKRWRERGQVVGLDGPADQMIILPIAQLTDYQRHALRSLLRSVIPTSQ